MINSLSTFRAFFISLLSFASTLSADQGSCELTQSSILCCNSRPLVELKVGYFFFSNSKMRKIYDRGGWDIQLSASYPLCNLVCGWNLNAYGAVEYFQVSGKSRNAHQRTSIWSLPVNIGLKPVYALNANLQYYFAVGPRYIYVHQHNHSAYVDKNRSRNGVGFFVNTGFNYLLCDHLVIDLFGEYTYAKVHFHSGKSHVYTRDMQLGGFTFGGGLGYAF